MKGCVEVYKVTSHFSSLAYTCTSEEWKQKPVRSVAVSESLVDSMLIICHGQPFVYQYPCHGAKREVKKYAIKSDSKEPQFLVANTDTAVVTMQWGDSIIVYSLPHFRFQSRIPKSFSVFDLAISSDYLLLMGFKEIRVKSLRNLSQDLCKIKPPTGLLFKSTCFCFMNHAHEIYAACAKSFRSKCTVHRYVWDGKGKPQFVYSGVVIDGLGSVNSRCLAVSPSGLLAVAQWLLNTVKMYHLQWNQWVLKYITHCSHGWPCT